MQPGDRLACAFVGEPPSEFKVWPLHVTIVPWFRVDLSSAELARQLLDKLCRFNAFQVVMADETRFGRGKTVNLVGKPTLLMEIEETVRDRLKHHNAWLVDATTKLQREYQPHVTAQKTGRLYRGDVFICDSLHIVEQKGDYKRVVASVGL